MSDRAIETLLGEERRFPPDPAFAAQANAQPDETLSEWELPQAKWYLGGTLNVCFNCVDRHVEAGLGERVAYFWEGEPGDRRELTYAELQREVVRWANALKELGVG